LSLVGVGQHARFDGLLVGEALEGGGELPPALGTVIQARGVLVELVDGRGALGALGVVGLGEQRDRLEAFAARSRALTGLIGGRPDRQKSRAYNTRDFPPTSKAGRLESASHRQSKLIFAVEVTVEVPGFRVVIVEIRITFNLDSFRAIICSFSPSNTSAPEPADSRAHRAVFTRSVGFV
jgi:hypothetical protein